MEKLFDETFSKNRTLWYGYFVDIEQTGLIGKIKQIIKTDLQTSEDIQATNWIFYRESLQKDALDEQIRSSIMVRLVNNQYDVEYNMSDFEFVTQNDVITSWCSQLKALLKEK